MSGRRSAWMPARWALIIAAHMEPASSSARGSSTERSGERWPAFAAVRSRYCRAASAISRSRFATYSVYRWSPVTSAASSMPEYVTPHS